MATTFQGFKNRYPPRCADNHPNTAVLDHLGDHLYENRKLSTRNPGKVLSMSYLIEPARTRTSTGWLGYGYRFDWYYRIHLIPSIVDLGNVFAPVTKSFAIWNAFFQTQILSNATYTVPNAVHIDYSPEAMPVRFGQLRLETYKVATLQDLPAIADILATLTFSTTYALLQIVGRRVILWGETPEVGHTESLEWKTDVLDTYAGEQRLALRQSPRQTIEYKYILDPRELASQQVNATGGANNVYGAPMWSDELYLGQVLIGQLAISGKFSEFQFVAGGLVVIYHDNGIDNVISDVISIVGDVLTLKTPIPFNSSHACVVPLRIAMSYAGPTFTRSHSEYSSSSIRFDVRDTRNYFTETASVIFRSAEVLTERYAVVGSLTGRIYRPLDIIDNEAGIVTTELENAKLRTLQTIGFIANTSTQKIKLRSWLNRRRGKLKPFWLPSWNRDVTVLQGASSTDTFLVIKQMGWATYYKNKGVMLLLKNGTQLYALVTSAAYNLGDDFETLVLSSPWGTGFAVGDIELACLLTHSRLDTDTVVLNHEEGGRITTTLSVIEVPE